MKYLSKLSLKHTVISISVIFTFIITFIVASFSYYSFNSTLEKNLIQSTTLNLYLVGEGIAKDMTPIISLANWTINNTFLSEYLELSSDHALKKNDYKATSSSEAKLDYDDSKALLRAQSLVSWDRLKEEYHNTGSNVYISRIVIGNETDNYLHIAPISSFYAKNITEYIKSQAFFNQQLKSQTILWTGQNGSKLGTDESSMIIPIIRPVHHMYSQDVIGWSYIEVSNNVILDAFEQYNIPSDSRLFFTMGDITYQLLDNQMIPVTDFTLKSTIQNNISEDSYNIKTENGDSLKAVQVNTSINGWTITQTLSKAQQNQQQHIYFSMLILITFIVLFLGLGLTYILSKRINHPISQLLNKMQLVSTGDFSKDPSIEWENELGIIGKGINTLAEDVMKLMETRIEDEKVKSQLEYQILQNQINPHFLYNTLNSIKWMATIQNADGIAEMTTALSKLLRTVSKETSETHSLSSELELLDHYFTIQKYRYGGSIELNYQIDETSLMDCQVPFFSLQPIVENAIFHGIEPKGSHGNIVIHIYSNNDDPSTFCIEIKDDGIGMSKENIDEIYTQYIGNHNEFFKKIGISNVHQRIMHIFGDQYGITINSQIDIGTTMKISLPTVRSNS